MGVLVSAVTTGDGDGIGVRTGSEEELRSHHLIGGIFENAESHTAIEIKSGRTIASDFFSGLNYYGSLDPACPPDRRFLVYGGREEQIRSNGHVVGWQQLSAAATWAISS